IFGQPDREVRFALDRLNEMEGAHLAAVGGTAADRVRRRGDELRIVRMAIAQREEQRLGGSERKLHAFEAARRDRADRQEAEADASLLPAVGDEPGNGAVALGERRPENAVGSERNQARMELAD